MRVAFNSFYNTLTDRFSNLNTLQQNALLQMSTGQKLTSAADDPTAMQRVLDRRTTKSQEQQFWRNAGDAKEISLASNSNLKELNRIFNRVQELATKGSSELTDDQSFSAYEFEVNQLLHQAFGIANGKLSGRFLHGGSKDDTQPFVATLNSNGDITNVTYAGNTGNPEIRISDSAEVAPRTSFAENQNILNLLLNIRDVRDAMAAKSASAVAAARAAQEPIEDALVSSISRAGGIQYRIEVAQRQSSERYQAVENLISRDTDVDFAEASVRLNRAQLAYQASIQSGAKIAQNSLLDYIR